MVNQEAFRDIHALIVEFPELHDQRGWEAPPENTGLCGTTRCLAGWATWWKAREVGLLSQKRQLTDMGIRRAVARELRIARIGHQEIGAAVLGLSPQKAASLFYDFNRDRVPVRVKSYADNGHDISDDEFWSYE